MAVPALVVGARGFSLVEMLVVVALVGLCIVGAAPAIRAYSVEAHILGAGRAFRSEFFKTRTIAVRAGVYTAIRFEQSGDKHFYSVYQDGNANGVRSADIAAGIDPRISGPIALTGGAPGVVVGFNPGVPAVPPDTGFLSGDPIRFGSANMLSFSPLGTATPGTFYLAGDSIQAAVRVNPGTARVRLLVTRGGRWVER